MAEQIEHGLKSLLAGDFLQIASPLNRGLNVALRKSVIENLKIQFAKKVHIDGMNGWGGGRDGLAIDAVRGQFRFVDVNDGVERIKDERGIMHGSLGARFPPNTSALRAAPPLRGRG
jgi:hypothetical protein